MSVFPASRVHDMLRRIADHTAQPEATKTCFGILAILSREDVNKMVIAREGLEIILSAMTTHIDKVDVQEAGCDLIWSLAFNSAPVKEVIAKYGGASMVVRALKRHGKSPEYMKSACGALSNMCQSKMNQEAVASYGGLQPLVGAIHTHQLNSKLLPFIFDAIASLIVTNEDNARSVSSLGVIPLIITSLGRHKATAEVVKSGCHALAILSDVKGQASKIAFAGGVPTILVLLDLHPAYSDLHRVAAVVLLRMLQESAHVAREIVCHEGIRIMLKSLDAGGARQDTVAAVTHILFAVTSPTSQSPASIEPQLWVHDESDGSPKRGRTSGQGTKALNAAMQNHSLKVGDDGVFRQDQTAQGNSKTALNGLVAVLAQFTARRDVARAACRLLNNLFEYAGVAVTLDRLNVLDGVMECVGHHGDSRDVTESAVSILRAMNKRAKPTLRDHRGAALKGLLSLYLTKMGEEEPLQILLEMIVHIIVLRKRGEDSKCESLEALGSEEQPDAKVASQETIQRYESTSTSTFEAVTLKVTRDAINYTMGDSEELSPEAMKDPKRKPRPDFQWGRSAGKTVGLILGLLETVVASRRFSNEDIMNIYRAVLERYSEFLQNKSSELCRRVNKLLQTLKPPPTPPKAKNTEDESSGIDESIMDGMKTLNLLSPPPPSVGKKTGSGASSSGSNSGSASGGSGGGGSGKGEDKKDENREVASKKGNRVFIQGVHGGPTARLRDNWPSHLERMLASQAPPLASFAPVETLHSGLNCDRMHIVYEGRRAAGRDLMSRVSTPMPYHVPTDGVGDKFEHSLTFDSEFESGNLLRAVQCADASYDLILRADMHTMGHTQWFYFAVSNTHPQSLVRLAEQGVQVPPVRVRFNIINFTKPDSLFNMGMRPVLYSTHDASSRGTGWVRAGTDISYYCSQYPRNNMQGEGQGYYYSLSFTMEFNNAGDNYFIAYCYPYTYSDYKSHISSVLAKPGAADKVRRNSLCTTLSGVSCDILTITDFSDGDRIGPYEPSIIDNPPNMGEGKRASKNRQTLKTAIVFSCRVHPGETPASWMMKGMIDFLTSDSNQARILRSVFVIFIVPILNPDGVIYGNNRCSLAGVDLNRTWKNPARSQHPTIWHLKAFMSAQKRIRDIFVYIDLHGHSRKHNVFMYGCDDKRRPKPQVRTFPRFLSLHAVGKKYVSYGDCSFHVKKGRESTARVVVAKELNIPLSFTLEATFCGISYGPLKHCHINTGHLQEVGGALCDAILNFSVSEGLMKGMPYAAAMLPAPGQPMPAGKGNWAASGNQGAMPLPAQNDMNGSDSRENGSEDVDSGSDESSKLTGSESRGSGGGGSRRSSGKGSALKAGRGRRQNRGAVETIRSRDVATKEKSEKATRERKQSLTMPTGLLAMDMDQSGGSSNGNTTGSVGGAGADPSKKKKKGSRRSTTTTGGSGGGGGSGVADDIKPPAGMSFADERADDGLLTGARNDDSKVNGTKAVSSGTLPLGEEASPSSLGPGKPTGHLFKARMSAGGRGALLSSTMPAGGASSSSSSSGFALRKDHLPPKDGGGAHRAASPFVGSDPDVDSQSVNSRIPRNGHSDLTIDSGDDSSAAHNAHQMRSLPFPSDLDSPSRRRGASEGGSSGFQVSGR